MSSNGFRELDRARDRQLELRRESERERIAAYGEELAGQPGPASLLVAAWLRAAADHLAPEPAVRRGAVGA